MSGHKKPWHSGDYQHRARRVVQLAKLNPATRCWRCGLTLAEHKPHRNGRPARWTAGHTVDGDSSYPLAPEASTCNYSAGATHGNSQRLEGQPHSERW